MVPLAKLAAIGVAVLFVSHGTGVPRAPHAESNATPLKPLAAPVLWVDGAGVGRCTPSTTTATYAPASACSSFDQAYARAACGTIVYVLAGSYPPQAVASGAAHAARCTAPIAFRSAAPLAAKLGGLTIGVPWISFSGFDLGSGVVSVQGWDSSRDCYPIPTTNVAVRNSIFGTLFANNVQHLVISGNSIGNVTSAESELHDGSNPSCPGNQGLVIRGNTFHDYINPTGAAVHMECLQVENVEDTMIDANRFQNCGQYDLFVSNGSPSGPVDGLTIQNNYFDAPCSGQANTGCAAIDAVSLGPTSAGDIFSNVKLIFNTFAGDFPLLGARSDATMEGDVVAYNITGGYPDGVHCGYGRWLMVRNMDSGSFHTCGTDFVGSASFVNAQPPAYNFDLMKGSTGVDGIRCPKDAPTYDIHGTVRPVLAHGKCDIGAFELPIPPTAVKAKMRSAKAVQTKTSKARGAH